MTGVQTCALPIFGGFGGGCVGGGGGGATVMWKRGSTTPLLVAGGGGGGYAVGAGMQQAQGGGYGMPPPGQVQMVAVPVQGYGQPMQAQGYGQQMMMAVPAQPPQGGQQYAQYAQQAPGAQGQYAYVDPNQVQGSVYVPAQQTQQPAQTQRSKQYVPTALDQRTAAAARLAADQEGQLPGLATFRPAALLQQSPPPQSTRLSRQIGRAHV